MPHETDGKSLIPLLKGRDDGREDVSFGYFNKGISMRTDKYRLTRYFRKEEPTIELYDHLTDPNETKNIAATHPELVNSLMKEWEKGNTGAIKQ